MASYSCRSIFGQSHPIYDFVFQNALKPLSASGFAMLGFFIATAAYRAFRVRNVDAAILLVCGCIMMLANIPIGEMIWGGFLIVSEWIMKTLNGAAMKGIVIGSGYWCNSDFSKGFDWSRADTLGWIGLDKLQEVLKNDLHGKTSVN